MVAVVDRVRNLKVWIKLTFLIWLLLLISWPTLIIWQSYVNRQEAIDQARASSAAIHEATLIGLTSMMITETVAKRDILLDQLKQLPTVSDLRVTRGESVTSQFGPGLGSESKPNDIEKRVLATGTEFSAIQSDTNGQVLHVVRPVIARGGYLGKDCLSCHKVTTGTALGAVSIKIPLGRINQAFINDSVKSIGVATLVAFILLGIIYFFLRNVVTRPLDQIVTELRGIATGGGDLTFRMEVRCQDEIGMVSQALNMCIEKLQGIVAEVKSDAENVLRTSSELAVTSAHVAANSEQTSTDAYGMATQVEMMTVTLESLANQAADVQHTCSESSEHSARGGDVILAAVAEMDHIAATVNESSRIIQDLGQQSNQISRIVHVIKEIADQTNLLALNAAIEAARAGEQGRGFAVVADEVRNLAARTGNSTQEIAAMIDKIQAGTQLAIKSMETGVASVDEGSALARQAGEAINQIKARVGEVCCAVNEISASLKDHAQSNDDSSRKVEEIARLTEENSKAFQETAITVQRINELASSLGRLVGRYAT